MTDGRLERELRALSDRAFPPTPSLVDAVIAGVAVQREPRTHRRWILAVAVAAIVAVILLLPAPRRAIARLLGIGGVTIEHVTDYHLPAAPSTDQSLGREVDLENAAAAVGFTPVLPDVPGLGDPTVFVRADVADGLVSLAYRNEGEEPGLIITEFRTAGEVAVAIKQLPNEATWRDLDISVGVRGFWVEGAHTITFYDPAGAVVADSARLVGNTLLWQEGDLTFRLESALPLADVLEIARAMSLDE